MATTGTGSEDAGSGSGAEARTAPVGDGWVFFFDATEDRGPRPLLTAALDLAGPPAEDAVALDLGCGSGIETLALLRAGWWVEAMDGSPEGVRRTVARAAAAGLDRRLHAVASSYEDFDVPDADMVYAGVSLPFCAPDAFPRVWASVRSALRPGGVLAVHLFGIHDSWVGTENMNFHSRDEVDQLLDGLEVVRLDEEDADGQSVDGPKHWHVFEVVARSPS